MNKLFFLLFFKPKYSRLRQEEYEKSDSFMLKLVLFHWVLVSLSGVFIFHDYILGPVFGALLFLITAFAIRYYKGTQLFRNLVALVLLSYSIILIQQSMGRIEAHFHIFVALSFLIIYRDMKNITLGAFFIIVHHFLFNYLQSSQTTFLDTPIVIYNYGCGLDITLFHAFFVLFEWSVLSRIVIIMENNFMDIIRTKEALQSVNANLENMVNIRTDEYKEAKIDAEEANKKKSEFLTNMSHEIRTPMNAIIGFTDLLEDIVTTPLQKNYVLSVKNSSKVLLTIINDILDLSKVEAGKMHVELGPTNVHDIANELKSIYEYKALSKSLELVVKIDEDIPSTLMLDEVRLRQVLFNLVSNAIKFTHEGSIIVHFKSDDDYFKNLIITVEDTGIGIPKEQHHDVFEAFTQQEGQKTREYGGTGLGLTIVRKLLSLMNGEVSLVSEVGKGSSFTIRLNDVSISAQERKEQEEAKWRRLIFQPATILITDDIELNRTLIAQYLKSSPFTILQAKNGKEAVDIMDKTPVDVVLMDIKMPVLNGYEATKLIKRKHNVPVIAITASVISAKEDEVNQIFDTFLEKPLSSAELFEALALYLPCSSDISENFTIEEKRISNIEIREALKLCPHILPVIALAKEGGDMESMESLVQTLQVCAQTEGIELFSLMAQQFKEAVESFDIERFQSLLERFEI